MSLALTEWVVSLDPTEVATNRTELALNSGAIRIHESGVDWGDSALTAFMADQKIGSSAVDWRIPNRIVTIPLGIGMDDSGTFDTARTQLHQKVSLLQREGGWLKRARTGVKMYADVVNATLHEPDVWGATGGVEDGVVLTLECSPDFYGDEIVLDAITGTGKLLSILKSGGVQAVIAGDYPARCRLVIGDTSGNQQKGVLWGLRSRHYDAASTAALFYEAESMTGLNGAASAAHSGASGGSTMKITAIPAQASGLWVPMLLTDVSSAQLTHQGSYRVWARVYATDAGSQVRLAWGSGSLASPTTNDAVSVPGTGAFYLMDLGTVRLDATPVAAGSWQGVVQVQDPNGSGTFEIDYLMLQPIDESSGRESAVTIPSTTVFSAANPSGTFSDDSSSGTVAWTIASPNTAALSTSISHYLKFASLGFAIPAGATVLGILVAMSRSASGSGYVFDAAVRLLKAGTRTGTDKGSGVRWPGSASTVAYGNDTDMWGTTWTSTDVNNAGFGFEIQASSGVGAITARVYSVTVTVYYKLATGFTVAKDVVIDASGTCEIRTEGAFRPDPTAGAWGNISSVLGDLPRLPPSGLEGRAVELLIDTSRGDLGSDPTTSQDGALDNLTATVHYRPSYLARP